MSLAELLQERFRGDIRFRGEAYLKDQRVSVTRVTPDSLLAVVQDDEPFETELVRGEAGLELRCSCTAKPTGEVTCQHLWATILTVDQDEFLAGTPRPGYLPPFTDRPGEWELADGKSLAGELIDSDDELSEYFARGRGQRPWEARLEKLGQQLTEASAAPVADREIAFEVDIEASRAAREVVLQVTQRQRRANGRWGKWKPLRIRPGRTDDVASEADRAILTYLAGAQPVTTPTRRHGGETSPATDRFRLPAGLVGLLLPQLGRSAHLTIRRPDAPPGARLEFDDAPPWQLHLRVDRDEAAGCWRVVGRFCREGDELSIEQVRLVIPGGLLLTETHIARYSGEGVPGWMSVLGGDLPFTVPIGEEDDLVDRLLALPDLPPLELPEPLKLEEIDCEPVPRLVLHAARAGRWRRERLTGELLFIYDGEPLPAQSLQTAVVQRDRKRFLKRDGRREQAAWGELEAAGFEQIEPHRRGRQDVVIGAEHLAGAVNQLFAAGWQVTADGMPVRQPPRLEFKIRSRIDWFELHADIDFAGHAARLPELLAALSRGDRTVRLDDGSLGLLPDDWDERFGLLSGLATVEGDHLRFAPSQVILLDTLLAARTDVDVDTEFAALRDRLDSFSGIEPCDEPPGFIGALRGYQQEGLGWLRFLQEFQCGGCLADDMGLGKTVQVLALLADREAETESPPGPTLVVVPRSLMFNWAEECARFCPDLAVLEYAGLERASLRDRFDEYDIVLTTYGTLRRDVLELKDIAFDYVVLDEAQTIKNAGSQVAKASRLLKSQHRLALSGTPIENHLGDLWSIFEFLNPGMLGRSTLFNRHTSDQADETTRSALALGLRPFILRRTKAQVASELPKKLEQTIRCELGPEQKRLYDEMRDHYRESLLGMVNERGLAKSRMHVLEALLRLRQASCHPGLLDPARIGDPSAKLDVLCPQLEELIAEGHKALVFSQFTSMLAIVRRHLDDRGIRYEYLDGQTRKRREHIERFQTDPDCGAFLISLKAGGLGLNLTAADYVFLLDPWWNPAVEVQAIDRAHRVGQTRPVFAYRLICRDTVEEKIAELQEKKRELADAILLESRSVLKNLTRDDLELLLS